MHAKGGICHHSGSSRQLVHLHRIAGDKRRSGQLQDPGQSTKMPDPDPDKSWKFFGFCLFQIPTNSPKIAVRPVSESRQAWVLSLTLIPCPDKVGLN